MKKYLFAFAFVFSMKIYAQSKEYIGVYNAQTYMPDTNNNSEMLYINHILILKTDLSFIYKKSNKKRECENVYAGYWNNVENKLYLNFIKQDTLLFEIRKSTENIELIYWKEGLFFSKSLTNTNENKEKEDDYYKMLEYQKQNTTTPKKKKKKTKEPDCFKF